MSKKKDTSIVAKTGKLKSKYALKVQAREKIEESLASVITPVIATPEPTLTVVVPNNYNAGIIVRNFGSHPEAFLIHDAHNIKIPGGMKYTGEIYVATMVGHLQFHGYTAEEIEKVVSFHEKKKFVENEPDLVMEMVEEVGIYPVEVSHLHYDFDPGNERNPRPCKKNFFFIEEYVVPKAQQNTFASADADVTGKFFSSFEEALDKNSDRHILWRHEEALRKAHKMALAGNISRQITIESLTA